MATCIDRARRCHVPRCAATILLLLATTLAPAGGTSENLLLLIDPSNNDSLYVGNYYRDARDIPDGNVIYMAAGAKKYADFADYNLDALFGWLANAGIDDHVDYIVVTPGAPFYVSAPGLVGDTCAPVTRFSISSVYTMAFIADEILTGTLKFTNPNRYYTTGAAQAFDSSVSWVSGSPGGGSSARRYFIGTLLGYTGENGNTIPEILAMIDRSVAVDGTRPDGTFYFMDNKADPPRNVRAVQYSTVVTQIKALGGQAEIIEGVLPIGHHDCLGIMTGAATPPIDTGDFTILSGAFCDHLTSYAATFDSASQTKLSRWIVKGASGSWGATEEPCNYTGKFPHAVLHRFYFQGLSLGEATLRSVGYTPFQMLMYGDPLTRPFAYIPAVSVDDAPTSPVSGTIVLTPTAATTHPTAKIAGFDLLVDGRLHSSAAPGETFTVSTAELSDGWHDLRVLAYDDTLVKSTGRWVGALVADNHGRSVSLDVSPTSGKWTTPFVCDLSGSGGTITEVRVIQNGRVLGGAAGSSATLTLYGLTIGAGPARRQAEALFPDGSLVRSAPVELDVAFTGDTPSGAAPVARSFTKRVLHDSPFLVELPATFDDSTATLTFELVSPPQQSTVPAGQTGPYRLMRPAAGAAGADPFTFRVSSPAGVSNTATVSLVYEWWFGDLNCDGDINAFDIDPFVLALTDPAAYDATYPSCDPSLADINRDGKVDAFDIDPFVALLTGG